MKPFGLFLFLIVSAFGQQPEWDTSGNGMLTGTYNFREVLWISELQASNTLNEAASQYGTITFDGQGNYSAVVSAFSSTDNAVTNYTRSGTYAISASGFGFIRRVASDGDYVYGAVANGVFIGSGTESGFNNLFVAARQPTIALTSANFNQRYTVAYANVATPNLAQVRDATFQINPNGQGSLGTVAVSGYAGGNYAPISQTINNATYTVTGGVATLNFGARNTTDLVSGSQQMFISPDGQLIFGGSTNGWDLFVGVRTPTATPTFSGFFYQAGVDVDRSALPNGTAVLDSYAGSLNVIPSVGTITGHQRVQIASDAAYEYTYADPYSLSLGSHDDFLGLQNFVSSDGNYRVGFGRIDYLGLNVAIKAPTFSGSGVFINPTGVVNAASFAPFTTGIAPGELITIFGTGLASGTFTDATFPPSLGNVSVRINGRTAPVYVVSPTQISAIVPYETPAGIAEIQVSSSGSNSNRITVYVNRTAPGVFAVPATGLGFAAALHGDYSLVSNANPARPGETIAVYLTGLGATNPPVATGAPGTVGPFSETTETLDASVGGKAAKIVFSGLAPFLRGLYQINIELPTTVASGSQYLDIGGPDALSSQIQLPISGPRSAVAEPLPRTRPEPTYKSPVRTRNGFDPAATGSDSSPSNDR